MTADSCQRCHRRRDVIVSVRVRPFGAAGYSERLCLGCLAVLRGEGCHDEVTTPMPAGGRHAKGAAA